MIGFSDGGATGEVSSEIQREQCIQIGVRRHWNHVHSSYIWSFAGKDYENSIWSKQRAV